VIERTREQLTFAQRQVQRFVESGFQKQAEGVNGMGQRASKFSLRLAKTGVDGKYEITSFKDHREMPQP